MSNDLDRNNDSPSSTPQDPADNSGESLAQGGDDKDIVNEQKQNNSVNQEEFVDDMAANTRFYDSQKAGLARNDDDTADAQKQLPTDPEDQETSSNSDAFN